MSSRRLVLIAAVAVSLGGGAAVAGPDTPAPGPAATQPAAPDWTAQLLLRADRIAQEVAKLRGLAPKQPIQRDVVDIEELRRRLVAKARSEKTAAELAAEEIAAKRWGLVPPDADYAGLLVDVLTEQIAGYYDPEDRRLYIAKRNELGGDWADMLLAHEIDHALQDQHYDLQKWMDLPPAEGDALLARQALVEGDGVVLMIELVMARQGLSPPWATPEVTTTMARAMEVGTGKDQLSQAPLAVRESLMFPYRAGMGFVAELRRRHPWSRVDDVFKNPPRSTEQILHPEAYLAGEAPMPVAARLPRTLSGFRTAHETVWGEQGVAVFLRQHGVAASDAAAAAAGWGGDRAVVWAPPRGGGWSRSIGAVYTVWDSEIDAMEAAEALTAAVDQLVLAGRVERAGPATRWYGLDASVAFVERRGDAVVLAVGVPLGAARALPDQIFTTWSVTRPPPPPASPEPVPAPLPPAPPPR